MISRRLVRNTAVAIALTGAVAGGYLYRGRAEAVEAAAPAPAAQAPATVPVAPPAAAALPDFSAIVQRYGPAVVNVSVTATVKGEEGPLAQLDPDDPMAQFFRHFGVPMQRGPMVQRGLGSGFIVKPDGLVLTNAHVVDGATDVKVKLTDKREFKAKVIGVDKTTDVAVLKIDAKGLPTVAIGDPSRTKVGEWVLAIGSPFGFENSATAGIVSGRSRSLPDAGYVRFLQTDVAVNPGNSGGPLFDTRGEVIGVNSQILSQTGGYMGLSFAIPIDVAMHVEQELVAHGRFERGRLGIAIQDVTQPLAESFGLGRATGALVSAVEKDSPAARAKLEAGDVILAVNGKEIASSADLPPLVADLKPGADAKLEIWRDHARRTVDVKVGASKEAVATAAKKNGGEQGRLGLAVRPLTPEEQKQAQVDGGLVVEDVRGPAAKAGIRPGDVVLALNGQRVRSVDQLRDLIGKAGHHVALLVERGDAQLFVPLELG